MAFHIPAGISGLKPLECLGRVFHAYCWASHGLVRSWTDPM